MGEGFSPKMSVKALTDPQVVRIHQLFRQAKFDNPSGEVSLPRYRHIRGRLTRCACMQCLSPAGEYNLRLGIVKELHPDLVATYQGR